MEIWGGRKWKDGCGRFVIRWKEEGWPEGWKEGMIVPIIKRGEGGRVEDYRGVTLTQTTYKVYAAYNNK